MATREMTEVIDLVNSEAARLGDFLTDLGEQSWSRDSACQGWKVGDVVAHLAIAAETWAVSLQRALAGDAGPPAGQSYLAAGERGSAIIAQAAVSHHRQLGRKLLQDYTAGYGRLSQVLSSLSAVDWDKPCFHRRGNMPVRDFVAVRVQELAVHGWDIRSGLDPSAEIGQESLPQLVKMTPRWLRSAFRPDPGLPTPARFRFEVSGPVPVRQDVVVNNDSFQTEPAVEGRADVIFRCNTGNYILLIYGRLSVAEGLTSGRLSIDGSRKRATHFTSWFQGF